MIDLVSFVEPLAYAGSALLIGLVLRELRRPGGALSLAELLRIAAGTPGPHVREDEPVRWNVERLTPRGRRHAVTEPATGRLARPRPQLLGDRPVTACEGC